VGVGAQGHAEGTGKTEISKLQVSFTVDEQVLWLQVAVQDAVTVAVPDALAQLAHELLDNSIAQTESVQLSTRALGKGLATTTVRDGEGLHVLLQVQVEELADKIELVAVGVNNVEQADDVGVAHLLQQGDLTDGSRGDALVLGLESDLLEGHDAPAISEVARLVDDAIGT
jgi:hypothetical protein